MSNISEVYDVKSSVDEIQCLSVGIDSSGPTEIIVEDSASPKDHQMPVLLQLCLNSKLC